MSIRRTPHLICCIVLIAFAGPGRLQAGECDRAIAAAAASSGIAPELLYAVALTESGRADATGARPWPWTLNAGGEGHWFDTREEAERALMDLLGQGRSNIDIGCFQLNWRWHAAGFSDPASMLDPALNADYAARFLLDLYQRSGSWDQAVASYHSGTKELAEIYMNRFVPIYASVTGSPVADWTASAPLQPAVIAARINLYPLLQAGLPASAGSLMPVSEARAPLIDPS